ncbi:MAG: Zn-ribbon containing protein (DUF2072), partial [halophilic archaeon J07HX5]
MPHRCTSCGQSFDDGSKEMLSGCPQCGGTTFQFHPDGADPAEMSPPAETAPPEPPGSSVTKTVGSAATTIKELFGTNDNGSSTTPGEHSGMGAATDTDRGSPDGSQSTETRSAETPGENSAQASARGDPIETLPPAPDDESIDETHRFDPPIDDETDQPAEEQQDRPGLSELREELNDQFESIKVLQPGQYELNLMELYNREE